VARGAWVGIGFVFGYSFFPESPNILFIIFIRTRNESLSFGRPSSLYLLTCTYELNSFRICYRVFSETRIFVFRKFTQTCDANPTPSTALGTQGPP
jgi:hypothetical protein